MQKIVHICKIVNMPFLRIIFTQHSLWKKFIGFYYSELTYTCSSNSPNQSESTTFDHINIKYIWGPHAKPYGDPTLITCRDLQKMFSLNKYHFHIFIYYKETMKNC